MILWRNMNNFELVFSWMRQFSYDITMYRSRWLHQLQEFDYVIAGIIYGLRLSDWVEIEILLHFKSRSMWNTYKYEIEYGRQTLIINDNLQCKQRTDKKKVLQRKLVILAENGRLLWMNNTNLEKSWNTKMEIVGT